MERKAVQSSQISSIGFDPESKTLEIEFKAKTAGNIGSVYQYPGVSQELHDEFLQSESIGSFFGKRIKGNADHPHTKISAERAPEPKTDA